jgi:uncharacterized protein YbbC (DUF1343 family)/CubicO group peptidase (beta-lactamase class C family)
MKFKNQSSKFKIQSSKFNAAGHLLVIGECLKLFVCGAVFLLLTAHCLLLTAQSLPVAAPNTVGMSAEKLKQIDALVEKDIADKKLPGAVVLIGRKGKIVYRKAFGNRALVPAVERMTVDTIFDVASLTKSIATATSVMILIERGQLRLNDTIGKFIPEIENEDVKKVTVQQLLTHVSGFAPDFDLREKWTGPGGMIEALKTEKLHQPAGTKFVYSDIGFIVLGEIVLRLGRINGDIGECVSLSCLDRFTEINFLQPLKMKDSQFFRLSSANTTVETVVSEANLIEKRVAPTENIKGQSSYLGSNFEGDEKTGNLILRGQVHDPTAFRMGGVAGHAGLFSTADDLARYCQMLLNGGSLDGNRVLSAATIEKMTAPYVVSETGATRGLGWDINTAFSSNRGELFPLGSFGHTGFTGTSVWIDRVSQTFVVFLSNRVHPDGKGDATPLRAKVATVVASAIEDVPVEAMRLAESVYSSQVAAQIPNFVKQQSVVSSSQPVKTATVLNGIDVLEKEKFKQIENLRIGLVTNHTGRNLAGTQTIDVLKNAQGVKLVALFSPEHGIRGQLDQEKIVDSTDEKTGLPVYSLYGETRRPKPEHLKDLDAIIFDIQDIGARFYTYISTLQNVMEEAAKAGKPVFILDRPNPINGIDTEGAIADTDKYSFVATHNIPVRHAMTIGEIAQMFNAEKKIGADLRVIKMENWQRRMWFDETSQTWTNPSPNMRSLTEATLYPGIGMLEYTNISVGRGTDTPFEVVGAPWIDGRRLAAYLNQRNLTGVRFVPVRFKPNASNFKDEEIGGINLVVTDREKFKPVKTGIEIALAFRNLYANEWKTERLNRLVVNDKIFNLIMQGASSEEIEKAEQNDLAAFAKRRAQFLLYK